MWRVLWMWLLDVLYPPVCALCGARLTGGRALCGACGDALPRLHESFCATCGMPFDGRLGQPAACPNCEQVPFAFEFARPAMRRDEGTMEMIHRLKYNRELHLAGELGRLAAESFGDPRLERALAGRWPLVPVPLHRRRLRWRHFNQSAEIARALSRQCGLPVWHALRRVRPTGSQTVLGRRQRMRNLRGAFALLRRAMKDRERSPEGVVLIDDVLTTGSTAHECARTLKKAGVRQVVVVTVMRG